LVPGWGMAQMLEYLPSKHNALSTAIKQNNYHSTAECRCMPLNPAMTGNIAGHKSRPFQK
jgi:hypothetical protein